MTYGRPLMLHPSMTRQTLVLPSMVDDEFLTRYPNPPGYHPKDYPSVTASYSHTLRLQEILGEILSTFYSSEHTPSVPPNNQMPFGEASNTSPVNRLKSGDFQDVFRLGYSLNTWHESLPMYLRVDEEDTLGDAVSRPVFSDSPLESHDSIVSLSTILARQANSLRSR